MQLEVLQDEIETYKGKMAAKARHLEAINKQYLKMAADQLDRQDKVEELTDQLAKATAALQPPPALPVLPTAAPPLQIGQLAAFCEQAEADCKSSMGRADITEQVMADMQAIDFEAFRNIVGQISKAAFATTASDAWVKGICSTNMPPEKPDPAQPGNANPQQIPPPLPQSPERTTADIVVQPAIVPPVPMPLVDAASGSRGTLGAVSPDSDPMDESKLANSGAKRKAEEDESAEIEYKRVMAVARAGRAQSQSQAGETPASGSESTGTN